MVSRRVGSGATLSSHHGSATNWKNSVSQFPHLENGDDDDDDDDNDNGYIIEFL